MAAGDASEQQLLATGDCAQCSGCGHHAIRNACRVTRHSSPVPCMSISVSIVEDDAKVRGSLVRLIDGTPGFRCLTHHSDAETALRELPKINPEVVLMDINLPGLSGVECV